MAEASRAYVFMLFSAVRNSYDFDTSEEMMMSVLRDLVGDMQIAALDSLGSYESSIVTTLKWLARASSNAAIVDSSGKKKLHKFVCSKGIYNFTLLKKKSGRNGSGLKRE